MQSKQDGFRRPETLHFSRLVFGSQGKRRGKKRSTGNSVENVTVRILVQWNRAYIGLL